MNSAKCVNYDTFQYTYSRVNHLSATCFPNYVNVYFSTELAHNAIAGPFESVPFDKFHVSPTLTQPKTTDSRRVIVNHILKINRLTAMLNLILMMIMNFTCLIQQLITL